MLSGLKGFFGPKSTQPESPQSTEEIARPRSTIDIEILKKLYRPILNGMGSIAEHINEGGLKFSSQQLRDYRFKSGKPSLGPGPVLAKNGQLGHSI